jgi:hypothetical protein
VEDLKDPFRSKVQSFLAALKSAGASVSVAATFRPPERAYLMHYCFLVAKSNLDPAAVPPMAGVDIDWVHRNTQGQPDLIASRAAASQMMAGYEIVFAPALTSRHTEGNAIDMDIAWHGALTIGRADGTTMTIASSPATGGNADLQRVGAGYGVIKLASDPPHWSSDGH